MTNFKDTARHVKEVYIFRHEPEYVRPLAQTFWRTLLFVGALGAAGILVFAMSVFWDVSNALSSAAQSSANQRPVIDRAALEETLALIERRRHEFEARKAAPSGVVDPSR